MKLNNQQNKVVRAGHGPIAVIAGPGTGKTRTLVERIKFLVETDISPHKILALTFTKKAAQEMTERLAGTEAQNAKTTTFHALCFELLKENDATPEFIPEQSRLEIIKKLPRPAALKGLAVRELGLQISRVKNLAHASPEAQELTKNYNQKLASVNLNDFDDLLLKVKEKLANDRSWRKKVQARFDYILVDEFQDTNAVQYELLRLILGNKNALIIGDPLQSIYGFRGAEGDIFKRFINDFNTQVVNLNTNYRSGSGLVKIANTIYPNAPQLEPGSAFEGTAKITEVLNEFSEAAWVIERIEKLIGGSDLLKAVSNDSASGASLRDFAVLYRSRAVAKAVTCAFERSGIPVQIIGDGSPYDEPQVQAIVQMLYKVVWPERAVVLPSNMTKVQAEYMAAQFAPSDSPTSVAENLMKSFGFEPSANLRQLFSVLTQFKTVAQAAAYLDDIAGHDFYDQNAEAVTLLTIHAAKGLEFNHVILIGANDGYLPSKKGDIEEEKRLLYVAITRAKQHLDVLYSRQRAGGPAKISPLLSIINAKILPRQVDAKLAQDERKMQKRRIKRAQTTLF